MCRKLLTLLPMIAMLAAGSLACCCVPLLSPQSSAPKAGHWEGEPDLTFDVTESGEIQNLEMTVAFPTGSCTVRLDTLEQENGEYLFGDLAEQEYPQYIRGRFTNSETFKGTYAVSVCRSGGNYSVAFDVEEEPLTAQWKNP